MILIEAFFLYQKVMTIMADTKKNLTRVIMNPAHSFYELKI